MTDSLEAILSGSAIGVMQQDLVVELVNISRSGCLLTAANALPIGTLATLSVHIDGETYTDDVRVARCLQLSGAGGRHHIGLEFLPLRYPGPSSLRLFAASLDRRATTQPPPSCDSML